MKASIPEVFYTTMLLLEKLWAFGILFPRSAIVGGQDTFLTKGIKRYGDFIVLSGIHEHKTLLTWLHHSLHTGGNLQRQTHRFLGCVRKPGHPKETDVVTGRMWKLRLANTRGQDGDLTLWHYVAAALPAVSQCRAHVDEVDSRALLN